MAPVERPRQLGKQAANRLCLLAGISQEPLTHLSQCEGSHGYLHHTKKSRHDRHLKVQGNLCQDGVAAFT